MRLPPAVVAAALSLSVPTAVSTTVLADDHRYTVEAGDSLWSIAQQHDVSVRDLADANGLELSHTLHPDDALVIPGPVATVRSGDSLWAIARRHGVGLHDLVASAGLEIDSTIHPGQTLDLPGGAKPVASVGQADGSADSSTPTGSHAVRAGDGFAAIARRLGVSEAALLAANAMTRTTVIHPGQRLIVPGAPAPSEVTASDDLRTTFRSAAAEAGVPSDLLMAVGFVESRWNQAARSPDGAIGIGQLMPSTASWVARDLMGEPDLDPTRTIDNVRMSAHLLAWLLDEGGSVDRALAMYLQGVYGVRANGISAAAVTYADRVDEARNRFG